MNYHIAVLAVLKVGSGLTQRAAFNRIRGVGLTSNDIARAVCCTPRYARKVLSQLSEAGVIRFESDHAGLVGRPAYRWFIIPDAAEVYYTGSNDPDIIELFWHDALSELYSIRSEARKIHAQNAIGRSFDNEQ